MSYSHLATEAMRRAAAAVERQKAETTCRILDEFGITFDWGAASSYSSSAAAAPNPSSSSLIPPESSDDDDQEMMNEQEEESVGDEQMIAGNHVADDQNLVQPCSSPLLLHHSAAAAAVQKPTSSVSTTAASSTDTVTSTVVTSTAIFATSTTTTVVAASSSNAASTLAGRPAAPLYLGNISNIHHHTAKQHIEVLEKMALDGTFGQLAQQVPARLVNVYNTIGALIKVAGAQEQRQQQHQQLQKLQKQHSSPPRSNSRDPLRSSHLDSGDEDENVRSCIVPSGMRKVVGHKGAMKASMNVAPHSRRHDEPRVRNSGFETIRVKKALWEEFENKKISIDVFRKRATEFGAAYNPATLAVYHRGVCFFLLLILMIGFLLLTSTAAAAAAAAATAAANYLHIKLKQKILEMRRNKGPPKSPKGYRAYMEEQQQLDVYETADVD